MSYSCHSPLILQTPAGSGCGLPRFSGIPAIPVSPAGHPCRRLLARCLPLAGLLPLTAIPAGAADFRASDGVFNNNQYFGYSLGLSGGTAIAGAAENGTGGSVYVFRNVPTATGAVTESARLTASDAAPGNFLGWSVSLSGNHALAGASAGDGPLADQGAAYFYRDIHTATGTVTESVRLAASDGAAGDQFGAATGLSGGLGLVGANTSVDAPFANAGAVYVFRGLDTAASGTVNEVAKLTASDVTAANHSFGVNLSVSGTTAIVTANAGPGGTNAGSVYLFRNLDTATGSVTEDAKLVASDGAAHDLFGHKLSLSGSNALIPAYLNDGPNDSGSVYLFRNLDTATGTLTENAILTASDPANGDNFGYSTALSGNTAIAGSPMDDDKGSNSGSVYLYTGLDAATSTTKESVKITASAGASQDNFGYGVALDGDTFLVSSVRGTGVTQNTGNMVSGSVSSITTLDSGGTARIIDGISFNSRRDWVVGRTTDGNQVTLKAGNTATVSPAGQGIYIGQEVGADGNTLIIGGTVNASMVTVGAQDGSTGNTLQLDSTAVFSGLAAIRLADENELRLEGDYTQAAALFARLGATSLQVWDGAAWEAVTEATSSALLSSAWDEAAGYTSIRASTVPEPGSLLLLSGSMTAWSLRRCRRRKAAERVL